MYSKYFLNITLKMHVPLLVIIQLSERNIVRKKINL